MNVPLSITLHDIGSVHWTWHRHRWAWDTLGSIKNMDKVNVGNSRLNHQKLNYAQQMDSPLFGTSDVFPLFDIILLEFNRSNFSLSIRSAEKCGWKTWFNWFGDNGEVVVSISATIERGYLCRNHDWNHVHLCDDMQFVNLWIVRLRLSHMPLELYGMKNDMHLLALVRQRACKWPWG